MALPNPNMDFTALQPLPAAQLDDIVENIHALADGTAFEPDTIPTEALSGEVTPDKLNPVHTIVTTTNGIITPPENVSTVVVTALGADTLIAAPAGTPQEAQGLMLRIKDDGTARAITWGLNYRAIGVTLPTTTTVGKLLYVTMRYNAPDSKWDVLSVGKQL